MVQRPTTFCFRNNTGKPHDKEQYAVVIEFKHKSEDGKNLKEEAQKGLNQIDEKAYIHHLKKEGYERIYKYGIAFHKKNCEVAMESETAWLLHNS